MGVKSIMKAAGDLLSPNDPELVQKTLTRLDEQDRWNDLFSTKLIELLDKQDGMRSDLRHKLTNAATELQTATERLVRAENLSADAKRSYERGEDRIAAATALLNRTTETLQAAENLLQKSAQQARRTTQFAWATATASGVAVLCLSFAHTSPLLWTSRLAALFLIVITSVLMGRLR